MSTASAATGNPVTPGVNRAERLLLPATFITNLGNGIQLTAATYLVFTDQNTMLSVSWLVIAVMAPQVALSLFFGKLADRFDRRMLAVVSDVVSAVAALALPVALFMGGSPDVVSYVASAVLAVSAALFMPASNALIKERIPEARLGRFNGNFEVALQAGTLLSAAVGGFFIAAFGVQPVFYFNAVTFALSAALLFAIGRRPAVSAEAAASAAAKAAASDVAHANGTNRPPLKRLALLYALGNIVIIVGNSILLILVVDTFNSTVGVLGIVDALFGIGALMAGFVFKKASARATTLKVALAGYISFSVVLALETTHLWIMMAVIPLAGITFCVARIAARTALMTAAPEHRAGFIFGATNAFGLGAGTVATVLISLLVDKVDDARPGYWILAGLISVLAVVLVTSLSIKKASAPVAGPANAETPVAETTA